MRRCDEIETAVVRHDPVRVAAKLIELVGR
jgi:hypothetical protein